MFEIKKKTIEAEFELVTPAFIGGADQDEAELRPPSIKGALRFWWRALRWGPLRSAYSDDATALRALHREEADLFGSAAEERKGSGQGLFLTRLRHSLRSTPKDKIKVPKAGYQYLLGQGLFHHRDLFSRGCLAPGKFHLELILKPGTSPDHAESLGDALLALGMFGGLGSRARHGVGSVAIQKLRVLDRDRSVPVDENSFGGIARHLLGELADPEPPFSAFSRNSRVDISLADPSAMNLLNALGDSLLRFRSNGESAGPGRRMIRTSDDKKDKVLCESLRFWISDHNLLLDIQRTGRAEAYPRRLVFGLPHNYYFKSAGLGVEFKGGLERRASPLFAHVHRFPGSAASKRLLIHTCLRSRFLPPGQTLAYRFKQGGRIAQVDCPSPVEPAWEEIDTYLKRFPAARSLL